MITQMSAEEMQWKAECDARTLAEAETIKADKSRYARATQAASKLLEERQKMDNGLKKVANIKVANIKNRNRYSNPATRGKL